MKEVKDFETLAIIKYLLHDIHYLADSISNINDINQCIIKVFSDNIVIAIKIK